jgi:2,4-dienoyl-CoA reductase-like NADH-dependent reductase (Old Yellow Enzyme family)
MAALFEPIRLRELTLKNRIVISPMCQYSAEDGVTSDYHLVHYGRFALGGAGLVFVEASAVVPEGRITHGDLGIWSDEHLPGLTRIAAFLKTQGSAAGIQLGHAGRKASMQRPWYGNGPLDGADLARGDKAWEVVAPSPIPMDEGWLVPTELTLERIGELKQAFVVAARRAEQAGFDVIELHCAHGYLLHEFLSPLSNRRTDQYGGDRDGRMRLPLEIASALRETSPPGKPLFVRVSAVDGLDGGVAIEDTLAFAERLKQIGVDVVDCSSGGLAGSATAARVTRDYGFQVPFAERIRCDTGVATMAVGLITDPHHAEAVVGSGQADLLAIGREALADPNWPLHAEAALAAAPADQPFASWPKQAGWWLERRARELARLGPWQGKRAGTAQEGRQ